MTHTINGCMDTKVFMYKCMDVQIRNHKFTRIYHHFEFENIIHILFFILIFPFFDALGLLINIKTKSNEKRNGKKE